MEVTEPATAQMLVLIDTWWNVNAYINIPNTKQVRVLIDTWWNVNKSLFLRC